MQKPNINQVYCVNQSDVKMLFIVEYGRNISKCVKCEKSIEIAVLRMGKFKLVRLKFSIDLNQLITAYFVQANSFDGAMITWYHVDCFFETTIVGTTSIAHYNKFQLLNYKDQVNLLAKIGAFPSVISDPNYREQCLRFDEVQQILTVESVKSKDLATLLKENDQFFPKGVYEVIFLAHVHFLRLYQCFFIRKGYV